MRRSAFTLVELSIVLVILGLLVGGVLAGQSLIRSAELRSAITEKDRYVTAINAFKEKYMAIPGDMANAYAFWGAACGTNATTKGTGCNGNGDGVISDIGALSEWVKAWEHLARAGLVEGNFDGTGTDSGGGIQLDANNAPKSKLGGATWNLDTQPCESCGMGNPDVQSTGKIHLALGRLDPTNDPNWIHPLDITNAEAWNIDTKADDGRALSGRLRGVNSEALCDDAGGSDDYNLSTLADVKGNCVIDFIL